jgi:hypothetical protein
MAAELGGNAKVGNGVRPARSASPTPLFKLPPLVPNSPQHAGHIALMIECLSMHRCALKLPGITQSPLGRVLNFYSIWNNEP